MEPNKDARRVQLYLLEVVLMCFVLTALELARSYIVGHRYGRFAATLVFGFGVLICMGFFYRRILTISLSRFQGSGPETTLNHQDRDVQA